MSLRRAADCFWVSDRILHTLLRAKKSRRLQLAAAPRGERTVVFSSTCGRKLKHMSTLGALSFMHVKLNLLPFSDHYKFKLGCWR